MAIASTGVGLFIGLPAAYAVSRYKLYKISLIILVVPIILLSLAMQKYIISGLTAGAVKG